MGRCHRLEGLHAFDFRLRHAMQAVLTHLRFADAAESLSRLLDLDLKMALAIEAWSDPPERYIEWLSSVLGVCAIGASKLEGFI